MNKEDLLVQTRCFIHDPIIVLRRLQDTHTEGPLLGKSARKILRKSECGWMIAGRYLIVWQVQMSGSWGNIDSVDSILCDLAWWQGVTNQVWGDKQQLHSGRCGGTLRGTAATEHCIVQLQGGSYPHQQYHHQHLVSTQITGITLGTFIQFPNWVKHRTIFVSRSGADDTDWIWKHCQIWQQ